MKDLTHEFICLAEAEKTAKQQAFREQLETSPSNSAIPEDDTDRPGNKVIIRKTQTIPKSKFDVDCLNAYEVLQNLKKFLHERSMRYLQSLGHASSAMLSPDLSGEMTDEQREQLDSEVCLKLRDAQGLIEALQQDFTAHQSSMVPQKQQATHQLSILQYLDDTFKEVSEIFESQRMQHLNSMMEKRYGYSNRVSALVKEAQRSKLFQEAKLSSHENLNSPEFQDPFESLDNLDPKIQKQLEKENELLLSKLESTTSDLRNVEEQVMAIFQAQKIISENLMHHKEDINYIHKQTLSAQMMLQSGNDQLKKSIDRRNTFRTFIVIFFLAMSFILLFLHWSG